MHESNPAFARVERQISRDRHVQFARESRIEVARLERAVARAVEDRRDFTFVEEPFDFGVVAKVRTDEIRRGEIDVRLLNDAEDLTWESRLQIRERRVTRDPRHSRDRQRQARTRKIAPVGTFALTKGFG